jgi:hypothetical protein
VIEGLLPVGSSPQLVVPEVRQVIVARTWVAPNGGANSTSLSPTIVWLDIEPIIEITGVPG